MTPDPLANAVLDTLRRHLRLAVTAEQVEGARRITAVSASGERWIARHEDHYKAAVMLAELVGFDLEE